MRTFDEVVSELRIAVDQERQVIKERDEAQARAESLSRQVEIASNMRATLQQELEVVIAQGMMPADIPPATP